MEICHKLKANLGYIVCSRSARTTMSKNKNKIKNTEKKKNPIKPQRANPVPVGLLKLTR